jgi:hypothetical protein
MADLAHGVDVAILAKNEVADSSDHLALVVDHGL